jgi:hypothetical protein
MHRAEHLHALCLLSADMGRGSSDRQVSKKYISYLHEWDRRLKKTVHTHQEDAPAHRKLAAGTAC